MSTMNPAIFLPRQRSTSRLSCSVKGCSSRLSHDLNLQFHYFPPANKRFIYIKDNDGNVHKIDQQNAWKHALHVEKVGPCMKVCSLHFKMNDYILPDAPSKRKCLKKTAVPSCNLPNDENSIIGENKTRFLKTSMTEQMNKQMNTEVLFVELSDSNTLENVKCEEMDNWIGREDPLLEVSENETLKRDWEKGNTEVMVKVKEEIDIKPDIHSMLQ